MLVGSIAALAPALLYRTADAPHWDSLPMFGTEFRGLLGSVIFGFGVPITIPSWLVAARNEQDVPRLRTINVSLAAVAILYIVVGVVGAVAHKPYFATSENLLTKLQEQGTWLAWSLSYALPLANNPPFFLTSIPTSG